jgi:uncharacterized protein with FMN-binding domain
MPKRGAIAAALTVIGLVALLSFKTPSTAQLRTGSGAAVGQASPGTGSGGVAGATPSANGTITGPVVSTQFGTVQVQITVSGGKVTDVQALQLPNDRIRSMQISQYVGPILRSEALQAQSAQISLVSGATFTSEAYARSLQAALQQAGI